MLSAAHLLILTAGLLFLLGACGLCLRKNMFIILLSLEILIHGSLLFWIAADWLHGNHLGQTVTLFIFLIATIEALAGLILMIRWYRHKYRTTALDMQQLGE